ncbi:hypothetical protein PYCCODRAFT_1434273 [Trametes coccinea BRFM310]|uniref:Uncharacterized protein n=1 Tax=Trametes coccinea (strain BRFM310) TaxID=1353009 RepID=A0A1Y2IRX1_TRAC3|nr:hypothetical protein PYCCODRAFT_1434273 [Trametes coccinea BRFM310]
MLAFLGHRGQKPTEFFQTYSTRSKPKERRTTKNASSEGTATRSSGRGKATKSGDDDVER